MQRDPPVSVGRGISWVLLIALCVLGLTLSACVDVPATSMSKAASPPMSWPTDEGVPVSQWYMRTQGADGSRMAHYIVEYGVDAKPGNTVVVLHGGWGAEHSYLLPAVRPLADTYRFVLYDQRGSLRTPVTPPTKITYRSLVDDLEQLRLRLGLEKLILLAHSMGNHLAYGYLRAHPDRVAGLILVGAVTPAAFGNERPPFLDDVWPDFAETDAVANAERLKTWERDWQRRFGQIAVAEGLLPADWTTRHAFESDRELARRYSWTDRDRTMAWRITFTAVNTYSGRNWRHMPGGMVYYNEEVAGALLNDPEYGKAIKEFWPALKEFRGPVRVIIGTHDYVDLGPTFWPKLVTKIPNARLDTIRNAGHSIWMDEPEQFTRALRSALRDTSESR